jgi:hypothetical protein
VFMSRRTREQSRLETSSGTEIASEICPTGPAPAGLFLSEHERLQSKIFALSGMAASRRCSAVWRRILAAIEELQRGPSDNEPVN